MTAALVISTFSALKLVSLAQEFGSRAHAELVETNTKSMFLRNLLCIAPLNRTTIPVAFLDSRSVMEASFRSRDYC